MRLVPFIAHDAATALAQIHAQLGEHAVVVSVRPLPGEGMARFLPGRGRIEVVAGVQDDQPPQAPQPTPARSPAPALGLPNRTGNSQRWPSVHALEQAGLAAEHAGRLREELERLYGRSAPNTPERERAIVRGTLASFWRSTPPLEEPHLTRPHVFIGPPGSGKTTTLCKWLTRSALIEGRSAKVWRLDGNAANTAEWLSIHCELLGVPLERFWSHPTTTPESLFIDLPGVEATDGPGLTGLCGQVAALGLARVHLVLNAAYETETLIAQCRAFAALEPEDVILTHLDEVSSPVRLWNFLFGTNCSVRFVSGGQKIPGDFRAAAPEIFSLS